MKGKRVPFSRDKEGEGGHSGEGDSRFVERSSVRTVAGERVRSLAAQGEPVVFCRLHHSASADIARIDAECNRPPWSQRLFENEFQNSFSRVYGVRSRGVLVGFLVCHTVIDEAHILSFGIAADRRQRGFGRFLLTETIRDLDRQGINWTTLEVRASNVAARALYDSAGFQEIGVRQKYYPDDLEDAIVMTLNVRTFVDSQPFSDRVQHAS